jgi:succinyl-CoA synthetase beta subunit
MRPWRRRILSAATCWVVKAQVHAGGRGKAGGVKLVESKEEIEDFASQVAR